MKNNLMTRIQFIEWFENNVCTITFNSETFSTAKEQTEYEPLMYNEYSINETSIEVSFEELEWGDTNYITRSGTFDEFINHYKEHSGYNLSTFGTESN